MFTATLDMCGNVIGTVKIINTGFVNIYDFSDDVCTYDAVIDMDDGTSVSVKDIHHSRNDGPLSLLSKVLAAMND